MEAGRISGFNRMGWARMSGVLLQEASHSPLFRKYMPLCFHPFIHHLCSFCLPLSSGASLLNSGERSTIRSGDGSGTDPSLSEVSLRRYCSELSFPTSSEAFPLTRRAFSLDRRSPSSTRMRFWEDSCFFHYLLCTDRCGF